MLIGVPSISVTVSVSPSRSESPINTGMITEPSSATAKLSSSAIGGSLTGVTEPRTFPMSVPPLPSLMV